MRKIYLVLLMGLATTAGAQNCFDGGTGADGAYHATSNTTIAGGTYNFTTFTIDAGVTVQVTGSVPLVVRCTGNTDINGVLQANGGNGGDGVTYSTFGPGGIGVAGGANGGDGTFASGAGPIIAFDGAGTGGAGNHGDSWSGGGGGGYSTAGASTGSTGGIGGPAYGDIYLTALDAGSGGGGGSGGYDCGAGGGGAGGGVIVINSAGIITVSATGSIEANGGNGGSDGTGNCGGGGGGSGGSIWLAAATINNDGNITAKGGLGGASQVPGSPYYGIGGNGADGRVRFDAIVTGSGSFIPAAGYMTDNMINSTITVYNISCNGDDNGSLAANAVGGMAPYTYDWSTTEITDSIGGLAPGSYSVTIADVNNCEITLNANVTEPAVLSHTSSSTPETTTGSSDGTASVMASGGTPPYMYLWAPGGGTTATITGLSTGNYTCTVTDANGCTDVVTVNVTTTTGISGITSNVSSVYPNPVTNLLNIEMLSSGTYQVMLVNALGETIHTQNFNGTKTQLSTAELSRGVYLYRVSGNGISATGTLIKE